MKIDDSKSKEYGDKLKELNIALGRIGDISDIFMGIAEAAASYNNIPMAFIDADTHMLAKKVGNISIDEIIGALKGHLSGTKPDNAKVFYICLGKLRDTKDKIDSGIDAVVKADPEVAMPVLRQIAKYMQIYTNMVYGTGITERDGLIEAGSPLEFKVEV